MTRRFPEAYVLHGSEQWLRVEDAVRVAQLDDDSLYDAADGFLERVENAIYYRYFNDDIYLFPGDDDAVITIAKSLEGVRLTHLPERAATPPYEAL